MSTIKWIAMNRIKIAEMEVFQMVDLSYQKFIGRGKNIEVNLMLHRGRYNHQEQKLVSCLLKLIRQKN